MKREVLLTERCSRRNFLMGTGSALVGAVGVGTLIGAGSGLMGSAAAATGAPKWPWPYVKLDPEKTAELAYREWYRVFCGAAVINSVFSQLGEKIGEPYASFPSDAFVFLEGGMAGWGTVCGSNAGANVVSNLITGPRIAGPDCENGAIIGSNMMEWYSETALPVFLPKEPKQPTKIIQTTSQSPLCHVSVGKWMKESGYALASPERKDRCARVAASVALKLVQDLNAWHDGDYDEGPHWGPAKSVGITAQQNCTECHGSDIPAAPSAKKT